MDDEYALCWNNFQETIANGFQNLYDRGDLIDVTLAVEGKLLHAHKIVLAICSPYFQEMFNSNPCKHPILILKDISFGVMCELLQFMYQGAVSVKQTDLPTFMKIAQTLQIRGLTTNANHAPAAASSQGNFEKQSTSDKSPKTQNSSTPTLKNETSSESSSTKLNNQNSIAPANSSQSKPSSESSALKRINEFSTDSLSIYTKKQRYRNVDGAGSSGSSADDLQNESIDTIHNDDVFIPPIPQISMIEPRSFDLNSVKREHSEQSNSPGPVRGCAPTQIPTSFAPFDYNAYTAAAAAAAVKQIEYPNDLHMPNDYSKNNYNNHNHMDIPASGGNIVMLSSTSLLHGNCVFNRNNTVATQQGMKTYWLCKSYRITMCRARCITHQGKIISATGVHNHPPHMKSDGSSISSGQISEMLPPVIGGITQPKPNNGSHVSRPPLQTHHSQIIPPAPPPHHHSNQHLQQQSNTVIQNMMHNVNLMQMSMLPHPNSPQASLLNHSSVTAPMMSPSNLHSPSNPRSHQSSQSLDSPGIHHQQPPSVGQIESSSNDGSNMADYQNSNNVDNSSSDQNYDGSMDLQPHSTFKIENM